MNLIVAEELFQQMNRIAQEEGRHKSKVWELAASEFIRRHGAVKQTASVAR